MRSLVSQVSIHKLEVFCLVAELSSVSRAAERLQIAQPAVSSHLRMLGEKLGVSLVTRSGRRVVLTEDGQAVYRWARDVVGRTREFEREMANKRDGAVGTATVGASMTLGSYVLPTLFAAFHEHVPLGQISLNVLTPMLIIDAVAAGVVDFAFTIMDPRYEFGDLDIQQAGGEALVLVASPNMISTSRELTVDTLADTPFVTAQAETPRRAIEEHFLLRHGVRRRRIEMELGHAEGIKRAAQAGVGAAFLFESSVRDELQSGALQLIQLPNLRIEVPIYRIILPDRKLSPYQLSLMQFLQEQLQTRGSGLKPLQND